MESSPSEKSGTGLWGVLWAIACLVAPFALDHRLSHPDLLLRGLLCLLGLPLLVKLLLGGSEVPVAWSLFVILTSLGALSDGSSGLDPALIWTLGASVGVLSIRSCRPGWVSKVWLGASVLMAAWACFRWLSLPFWPRFLPHGNPNLLAIAIASGMPQAIAWARFNARRRTWLPVLLVLGVLACRSKGAFLCLVGIMVCWGMMGLRTRGMLSWRRLALLGGVGMAVLLVCLMLGKEALYHQIQGGTLGIRVRIWEGAFNAWMASPWVGWGPGSFEAVYPSFRPPSYFLNPMATTLTNQAHSELLQRGVEEGLLGLLPWALLLILWGIQKPLDGERSTFKMSGLLLLLHGFVDITLRVTCTSFMFGLALGVSSRGRAGRPILTRIGLAGMILLTGMDLARTRDLAFSSRRLREAKSLGSEGDCVQALERVCAGLQKTPSRMDLLYEKGFLLGQLRRYPEAEEAYRAVMTLSPDFAEVRDQLSRVLLIQGKEVQARPHLIRALAVNPFNPETLWNLALVSYHSGDLAEANRLCSSILTLDPDSPNARSLQKTIQSSQGR